MLASDDCYKISKSQSIGTAWLLSDNSLSAYCADFPKSDKLCRKNTCKVYTVQPADTCKLMAASNNITISQLKAWNPITNARCHNLYKMNGTSIYISNLDVTYVTHESNTQCGQWYNVVSRDYCNMVTIKHRILLSDFVFLNPSLNENCTKLLLDISYCVDQYFPGRPGYHTPGPTGLPFTKVTFTPTGSAKKIPTSERLPFGKDTREDCSRYFDASQMQTDISGTSFRHQGDLATAVFSVELSELLTWNPKPGNDTEASSCSFKPGVRYCGRFYFDLPPSVEGPSLEFPIREGYDTNYTEFGDVFKDFTCEDFLFVYDLTPAQFFAMNPIVDSDYVAYCIRSPNVQAPIPSGKPTSVAPSSTAASSPSAPTHSGQPSNCIRWHTVVDGDDFSKLADTYFITLSQSSPAPVPTPTPFVITIPNQPNNAVSNYNKAAQTLEGDYCLLFAERNAITSVQLYAWNSALDDGNACNSSGLGGLQHLSLQRAAVSVRFPPSLFAERYPSQDEFLPAIEQSSGPKDPPSQFPRLAILNRAWKEAVEKITFRELKIKSNELDTLQSTITGNRRKHLTNISFTVLLPEYSDERLNDEAFTKGICDLFTILKSWKDDGMGVQRALRLGISTPAASPTDYRLLGPKGRELMHDVELGKRKDILYDRWKKSCLHLLKPDILPVLSIVQHLKINYSSRKLEPLVALNLATSLPNLKNVEWDLPDFDTQSTDEEPYNITLTSPQERGENRDHTRVYPSRVPSGLTYDPLSTAIRTFSQNLTVLKLSAHFDLTLFWPSPDDENAVVPSWPHLKNLEVGFNMIAPSGDWYFTGPQPSELEDDDAESDIVEEGQMKIYYHKDNYRVHPNLNTFDPFLAAFARAVANMPVLESFMITCQLTTGGQLNIAYHAPGKESFWGDQSKENIVYRRVYYVCEVGKFWNPEPETTKGLRGAGSEKFGGEVIERFIKGQFY
ncbi:hypothetical protein EJ02DRAFT_440227 [Clathrospora elynae]|uniref:LysM domain-containing protein n=1 Tax=Clathrospora elynae TaxID=706981 RepID=A0A6A5T5B8_9PLEO|nr:hypothetical protein EJ02DRAFT_440227 [Clathrospora elynae]